VPDASGGGHAEGRLRFRPGADFVLGGRTGSITLEGADGLPPGLAYVPAAGGPMRVVVFLHGAGGGAQDGRAQLRPYADDERLLLLAPQSRDRTWDVLIGGYGPDVENLDRLLENVAAAYPVTAYTLAGFSDGASYALSLGIANGDVFDSVMAFSPGFQAARVRNGDPSLFVSHGTQDQVLPIDRCSRVIVPQLQRAGFDVTYEEFAGGHAMPEPTQESAMGWLRRVGAPS
jgi:predicted esterase